MTTVTQCGHVFHHECIMGWLLGNAATTTTNDECPQCRQVVWDSATYQCVEEAIRDKLLRESRSK